MSYTARETVSATNSLNTYDSAALGPGVYTATAALSCNDEMLAALVAVKGAGAYVQSASSETSGDVSSFSQAFGSNNTAGNCIVVAVEIEPDSIIPANLECADTQGNTYQLVFSNKYGGGDSQAAVFVAFGIAAGANTVTVTCGPQFDGPVNAINPCIAIHEYANGTAVDTYDVAGTEASSLELSVSTSASGDLLFLMAGIVPACAGSPFGIGGGSPLTPPFPSPNWLVINEPGIGFTDRTSYLWKGEGNQHSWTQELRQRGQATIHLYVAAGDPYMPTRGSPVYLFDQFFAGVGWQCVFSGLIEDLEVQYISNAGDHYVIITAVSLESVFDTVYAQPMQFVNQTCGAILTAIFNAFENGCPVSLGSISAGATIPLFNTQVGQKISDIFDQLATTSEFTWNVNPATQQLFFGPPSVTPAPFTLQSSDILWEEEVALTWKENGRDYRNRQGIRLDDTAFPQSAEVFLGSGQQAFTLRNPVKQVVKAYVTIATPNFAELNFSNQPSPGDTFAIGPNNQGWSVHSGLNPWTVGTVIVIAGYLFNCTVGGDSASSQPPAFLTQTTIGDTVTDGVAIWTCAGSYTTGASGQITWEWVSTLDNTQAFQVLIGSSLAASVQNAVDAINAAMPYGGPPYTAGKGYTISLPTWENGEVNATYVSATQLKVTNKQDAAPGISALSASSSNFSWSSAQTEGGSFPQGSVGPNEPGTIEIQVYAQGTSTASPGLSYTEGSATINLATPLNSGTNLNVYYYRSDAGVIEVENTSLVEALALVSHGTGKYQQFTDQSTQGLISTSALAGLQLAQQIIAAYSAIPEELSFVTYRQGLQTGQELDVSLLFPEIAGTLPVLNAEWVIESIEAELVPVTAGTAKPWLLGPNYGHYKYTIKAVDIQEIASYLDFWEGLGGGSGASSGLGGGGPLAATSGGSLNTQGNYGLDIEINGTQGSGASAGVANLESSASVTVTDTGGGNYQFTASASSLVPTALKYTASWSAQTSVTVTHNLGTSAVLVQVQDGSGNVVQPQNIAITSVNVVTLTFGASFTGSVVVIGFGSPVTPEYNETFAAATSVTVTHNLNASNVFVMVYDSSGNQVIPQNIAMTSPNVVTLTFGASFAGSVVVVGLPTPVKQFNAGFTNQTSIEITHDLDTDAVIVQVYDGSGNQVIPENIAVTDANDVTLTFGASFTGSAVVIG
jgi:hypothetical protein